MKLPLKKILLSFLTLAVIVCAAIGVFYILLKGSVPAYNGDITFSGINSTVKIYRDSNAVPYIKAENETDAAFALGYVHAQERLFQMDIFRRAAEGRLSEIFGSRTVPFDKMFRTIGMYRNVKENYLSQKPEIKKILEAYSAGVNSYMKNAKGNFSFEFDVLNYNPDLWKPEESLVIGKMLAWELNLSWWTKISFIKLSEKLGSEKLSEVLPNFEENGPTIIPSKSTNNISLIDNFLKTDKEFRKFIGFTGTHIGSNNWAVNGKLSASGKPIIANDPHLAFQAPGKWMVAVIRGGNWNADGFTLPGVPAVIIGKNQNISWVLTNLMADDADFYSDVVDSTGTKYLLDNSWHSLEIIKDTILVKDSASVPFVIKSDHRGAIISDLHPFNSYFHHKSKSQKKLSMRWAALEFNNNFYSLMLINKAKNWKEFNSALQYFNAPGQNFIYADTEGNIGYAAAAKLPIRPEQNQKYLYDGSLSSSDWKSFIPFNKMPKMFNPKQNFVASANNKVVKNYPFYISNIWEPSSRIKRINELLGSKKKFSVRDFEKYQMDLKSKYAEKIVPFIIKAFNNVKIEDENLKISLSLLNQWNFVMDKESQTPSIYLMFYQKLMENIFEDEMGNELFEEYIFLANVPYRVTYKLLSNNNSTWFDNINTAQVETRDEIIRKSLSDALDKLENDYGKNPANWQWGSLHKVTFKHLFHGFNSFVDKFIDVGPFEIGGDGTTVFNTEYSFTKPFDVTLGPSMRFIYDFATPDKFWFNMPLGQSGNIFSSHYSDMTQKWLHGKYIEVNTDENGWANSNMKLLKLKKLK